MTDNEMKQKKEETFGTYLRRLRVVNGIHQADAGKALGLNNGNFVNGWESDKESLPIKYIPKLAKLYKVPTLFIREAAARREIRKVKKKYGLENK